MKIAFEPKVRDLLRDLMSLAAKAADNRKFTRDMMRIRNKFAGAPINVHLKEKDVLKILYFINLELKITENLFNDMAFEEEAQLERASEVHRGLIEAKEVLLKLPYKGEKYVSKK